VASIQLAVSVDADSIMASGMDTRAMVEFIKELEEAVGDWDFTLELAEHFAKLKAEHEREVTTTAPGAGVTDRG
jgi:hypothetical protein